MLYKEWIDDWLEYYVKPTVKDKTYNRYLEVSRQHLVPKLGDYNLDELTPIIIQKFITELMQTGNLRTGKGLSANSINGIIIVIRSSLTTAFSIGLMDELVVSKIKRPRNEEKAVECFTLAEQKKIEQAVLADKRDKMIGVILCLYTGLRLGELLALEWGDIDFSKCELIVSKTCHDGQDECGNYRRIIDTPKTSSSKRIITCKLYVNSSASILIKDGSTLFIPL
jgi:integrase